MRVKLRLPFPKTGIYFAVIYSAVGIYSVYNSGLSFDRFFQYSFARSPIKYIAGPIFAFLFGWAIDALVVWRDRGMKNQGVIEKKDAGGDVPNVAIKDVKKSRTIATWLLNILLFFNMLAFMSYGRTCRAPWGVIGCFGWTILLIPIGAAVFGFYFSFLSTFKKIKIHFFVVATPLLIWLLYALYRIFVNY